MLSGWEADESNAKSPEQTLDSYITCYNDSIENHKEKMHFGLHICRGRSVNIRFDVANLGRKFHGISPFL
jgi:methionine synthase II (cobalamin-independent)